jgi:hypothetical protein
MRCYDCTIDSRETPAIGVCGGCGMGVCVEHARVAERTVRRIAGPGVTTLPRPARQAVCGVCDDATRP